MVVAIWMIAGAVFGAVAGWLAIPRNRSALPWWALGALTGPIAIGILLAMGPRTDPRPAIL